MTNVNEPAMSAEERDRRLQKAYTAATQELREAHRDEFNDLYSKHAADQGVEWKPRLTPEQKAEQEFERLLQDFPHLMDRFPQEREA
jgi:hypothetical protein